MSVNVPVERKKHLKRRLTYLDPKKNDLQTPIHKGYMYKQSSLFGAFNRRFFALYPSYLVYYENEHDFDVDTAGGTLEHRHGAIKLERVYITKPDNKPKGGKYCFILHAPNPANKRHEFLLVTKERQERRQWMTVLQRQNPHLVSPESSLSIDDSPLPERKNRSESNPEISLNSTGNSSNKHEKQRGLSLTPNLQQQSVTITDMVKDDELDLCDGDSDHEFHEPDEETEPTPDSPDDIKDIIIPVNPVEN